jgi:hypothetical protein
VNRRRRTDAGPTLVTIRWRDLPAQVTASDGTRTEKALLPTRFQTAIDRAAKVADCEERDAYVAQWRRDEQPCDGDLAEAVARRVRELDASFSRERLAAAVRAGGIDPDPAPTGATP